MKNIKAFFRDDCPYSKQMSVDFYEFVEENKDIPVEIFYLTEETRGIGATFFITAVPTLIVFKDDKEYCRTIGARTKEELLDFYNYSYEDDV